MKKTTICIILTTILWGGITMANSEEIQLEKRDVKTFFQKLDKDTMYLVDQFYAKEMYFQDPVVEFHNREDMKHYYASAYQGAESVSFEVPSVLDQGNEQVIIWVMTMTSKALNKGKPIVVDGASYIRYDDEGKAIYHRDYFDMGQMIYDHVPFVRGMVKFVDKRMRKNHDPTVK